MIAMMADAPGLKKLGARAGGGKAAQMAGRSPGCLLRVPAGRAAPVSGAGP